MKHFKRGKKINGYPFSKMLGTVYIQTHLPDLSDIVGIWTFHCLWLFCNFVEKKVTCRGLMVVQISLFKVIQMYISQWRCSWHPSMKDASFAFSCRLISALLITCTCMYSLNSPLNQYLHFTASLLKAKLRSLTHIKFILVCKLP